MNKRILITCVALIAATVFSPARGQEELVYVAVEPCRVADTRQSSEGVIAANTVRNFRVAGTSSQLAAQGGESDCENPKSDEDPVAVAAYVIAVPNDSSTGKGVLSVYPSDESPPPVGSGSTVNFASDQTIGNTTIATLCTSGCPAGGELAVLARNTDEDVVIDVQGYFYPVVPTPAVLWAVVDNTGTLVRGEGVTGTSREAAGQYTVDFSVDIDECSYQVSIASPGDQPPTPLNNGLISAFAGLPGTVSVWTYSTQVSPPELQDRPFHLAVQC